MMITRGGMSDKIGNIDFSTWKSISSETAAAVESEIRRMLDEARDRGVRILKDKRNELDLLAKALVEYESLDLEEMKKAIAGQKIERMKTMAQGVPIKLPDLILPPSMGGTGQQPNGGGPSTGVGGLGTEAKRQNDETGSDNESQGAEDRPGRANVA